MNAKNEGLWLSAIKQEADAGETDQARFLLNEALNNSGTDRVYYKAVAFERIYGKKEDALDLVNKGLELYPKQEKLWMEKGQIFDEDMGDLQRASEAFAAGIRACPKSLPLYLLAARLEVRRGNRSKANAFVDRGRVALPKTPILWLESVRMERRSGNMNAANHIMSRALQECPKSGLLLAENIWYLTQRTHRRPRTLEAIPKDDTHPDLFILAARIFHSERKLEKAISWYERALAVDPDMGDTWAFYYKFLLQHGKKAKIAEVVGKCEANRPKHGEVWAAIVKNPRNVGKGVQEMLKMAADLLE